MLRYFCFTLLLIPIYVNSQGYAPMGARQGGTNDLGVTIQDVDAYFHNPAGTILKDKFAFSTNYKNTYALQLLAEATLSGSFQNNKSAFSIGFYHAGNRDFQTLRGGLGYAIKLTENFRLGIQININQFNMGSFYGSRVAPTGEFGVLYMASDKWTFGASIMNFTQQGLSSYQDDRFVSVMRIGGKYSASEKVNILAEILKDDELSLIAGMGVEYRFGKFFDFRFGARSQGNILACGFGYQPRSWGIIISTSYHNQLGFAPQFGLRYKK